MTGELHQPVTAAATRAWVRARSPQPFADDDVLPPESGSSWVYGPGQFELALLARLVSDGFAANRNVHYPGNYGRVSTSASFTATATDAADVTVRISGTLTAATVAGRPVSIEHAAQTRSLTFTVSAGTDIRLDVTASESEAPAVAIDAQAPLSEWTASIGGGLWEAVRPRTGGDAPPHRTPPGTVGLVARSIGDSLFDIGAPVLGRPVFPPGPRPRISSGESIDEALSDPETHETRHDLIALENGGWTTQHPLGFRYLFVDAAVSLEEITVQASVTPIHRPGAFACSDDELTRIWASAQYTLRLCMQGLTIDGIKRDRMPWAGDQALSTLANAYALGVGEVVADGLVALGQPEHGYVNGIADYSLWWLVNAEFRLRYFGDLAFAQTEAQRLDTFLADLARHAGEDGVFRPGAQPGGFRDAGPGAVFLDWGLELENGRDPVALQMLWLWALRSASRVLAAAQHPNARRWTDLAETLTVTLHQRGWLAAEGRWADYLDAHESHRPATYANFLAVLSGIHLGREIPPGVADSLARGAAGTPFMTAFRLRAMMAAGATSAALEQLRSIWGPMLDRGPGTFWEEATLDDDPLAMYGRPFGRSLSHAWASGPAAILPEAVMGIRPLGDGWTRFEVRPKLGDLEWATVVVPAPSGDIVAVATREQLSVQIPAGTMLVLDDGEVHGPRTATCALPHPHAMAAD